MAIPEGWTDDMSIQLPVGVTLDHVTDTILQGACAKKDFAAILAELVRLGLSEDDAVLAYDRVHGGLVRAATESPASAPGKDKDPLAWTSYQRCLREPSLIAAIRPELALLHQSAASDRDLIAAAERLIAQYQAQAPGLSLAAYRGSIPSHGEALSLIFRLHEAAHLREARRLESAFAAWLGAGSRVDETLGASAKLWQWARDLGALSDALSPEVRRALAHASRTGDLAGARVPLRAFAVVDRRSLADAEQLRELGGAFVDLADLLDSPDAIPSASRALAGGRGTVAIAGGLATLLVCLVTMGPSSGRDSREPLVPPVAVAGPREQAIEAVARLRGSLGDGPQDQNARAIARALADHDCGAALKSVSALTSGGPYPQTPSLVDAVAAAVLRACSPADLPGTSATHDSSESR
jgi:hypothetical protein